MALKLTNQQLNQIKKSPKGVLPKFLDVYSKNAIKLEDGGYKFKTKDSYVLSKQRAKKGKRIIGPV